MPVAVRTSALRRDGALVATSALLFSFVSYAYELDRLSGLLFLGISRANIVLCLPPGAHTCRFFGGAHLRLQGGGSRQRRTRWGDHVSGQDEAVRREARSVVPLLIALAGLAIVIAGGRLLVDGAIGIARDYGMSETVIGLTIVAIGTSMPEFVTSVVAAVRKQGDVALGNIMGSNIYNLLGIGGVTGLMSPTKVPEEIIQFDNLVMIGASAAMFAFAWSGYRIGRLEGAALLAGYVDLCLHAAAEIAPPDRAHSFRHARQGRPNAWFP